MNQDIEATHVLARYVVESEYASIPALMRHEAKRALLNWLGCAIGTARHETIDRALAAIAPFTGCCRTQNRRRP
jgi:2-methylcitrate dehydratase PrpD